jgi:hypothetical protein
LEHLYCQVTNWKDSFLVWNTETGKKDKWVPKQLRMISICELHNDLLKPVDEGRFKYALTEARKSSSATIGCDHCCPWSWVQWATLTSKCAGVRRALLGEVFCGLSRVTTNKQCESWRKMQMICQMEWDEKDEIVKASNDYKQFVCLPMGKWRQKRSQMSQNLSSVPLLKDSFIWNGSA